jgi:hypothetical protein
LLQAAVAWRFTPLTRIKPRSGHPGNRTPFRPDCIAKISAKQPGLKLQFSFGECIECGKLDATKGGPRMRISVAAALLAATLATTLSACSTGIGKGHPQTEASASTEEAPQPVGSTGIGKGGPETAPQAVEAAPPPAGSTGIGKGGPEMQPAGSTGIGKGGPETQYSAPPPPPSLESTGIGKGHYRRHRHHHHYWHHQYRHHHHWRHHHRHHHHHKAAAAKTEGTETNGTGTTPH